MGQTKITFGADTLRRLLANASLFAAGAKDKLPGISVAHFAWDAGRLLVVATNRYVLTWEEANPGEADGQEDFSLPLGDIKGILAMLPKGLPIDATVTYDSQAGDITVNCANQSYRAVAGDAQFIRWRTLRDRFEPGDRNTVVFAPEWLALLAKVDGGYKAAPVHFELAGDGKPARVSIGQSFKALVIPIKNAG